MKETITTAGNLPATKETKSLKQILKLHGEILSAVRTSLPKAIKIGELLSGIKGRMEHGQWLPWLESNLPFSERSAQNYIRCFDERERLKSATVADLPLSVTGALSLLSEPKTSPAPAEDTSLDSPISENDLLALPIDDTLPADDFAMIEAIVLRGAFSAGRIVTPRKILELRNWADEKRGKELAA